MDEMNRRHFVGAAALGAAALGAASCLRPGGEPAGQTYEVGSVWRPGTLLDTHVYLFQWPFRRLKYDRTDALVAKLRSHGVEQAWAGSYEGIFCKDIEAVNARLADECNKYPDMLIPFGTININLPDWEEDLRRASEEHRMPGIRLHPGYQNYKLDHPGFARLLDLAAERRLLVQLAVWMQDERHHNPLMIVPNVDVSPLPGLLKDRPGLRLQLLNQLRIPDGPDFEAFLPYPNVFFDTSKLETLAAFDHTLPKLPADRIAFGSYAPYFNIEANLLKLRESVLTQEQDAAIRFETARRLMAHT